jgi:hypothetical protein
MRFAMVSPHGIALALQETFPNQTVALEVGAIALDGLGICL